MRINEYDANAANVHSQVCVRFVDSNYISPVAVGLGLLEFEREDF